MKFNEAKRFYQQHQQPNVYYHNLIVDLLKVCLLDIYIKI